MLFIVIIIVIIIIIKNNIYNPYMAKGKCFLSPLWRTLWDFFEPVKMTTIKFPIMSKINRIHNNYISRTERVTGQPHYGKGSQVPQPSQVPQASGQVAKKK